MVCPRCGEVVPDTAKVCGMCGYFFKPTRQPDCQEKNTPVEKKKMSTWLKWILLIGGVMASILLFIMIIGVINRSRINVQIEAMQTETSLLNDGDLGSRTTQTMEGIQPQSTEIFVGTSTPTSENLTTATDAVLDITQPSAGDEKANGLDGAKMVFVPEGNFNMGAADNDPQAEENEKPQHAVFLDGFWIYKFEVTNQQYLDCMERGDCLANFEPSTEDHYPVVSVNWHEAAAYCEKVGGRLPSEAEWEKSARGVALNHYPWGDSAPNCTLANYSGCMKGPAPVGSYPNGVSPYGVMDMAGNVWEWVEDWYDPEAYRRSSDSNDFVSQGYTGQKVIRGGSWGLGGNELRVTFRGSFYPEDKYNNIGFRCVLSYEP